MEYSFLNEILESDQIPIYYLSSPKYNEEIKLFCNLNKDGSAVFNPYKMPEISEEEDEIETINLLEYIYLLNKSRIDKIDLRTLLLRFQGQIIIITLIFFLLMFNLPHLEN